MQIQILVTFFIILHALALGALCAFLAKRCGRTPYAWFCLGCLFGIPGALVIFFASMRKKVSPTTEAEPPPIPEFTIQGPSDKYWYYLKPDSSQIGPISFDVLTTTWKQGKISLTTYVWHEELLEWKLLQDLIN